MATSQLDPPLPGASFFDIYHDGAPARSPVSLPGGGCNFVDLTPGANGAKCGCRHFWSRFAAGRAFADNLGSDHTAWCMCTHHACYHDYTRDTDAPTPTTGAIPGAIPGQENARPKGNREPLSPVVQDASFRLPSGFSTSLDLMNLDTGMLFPVSKPERPKDSRPGHPSQQPDSTLQDTLSWGEFVQSPSANTTLPPIPPQCLMPSQPSSTTSSSQARYLRPFAGKGLNTLSGVHQDGLRSPLQEKPQDPEPMEIQSAKLGSGVVGTVPSPATGNGADTPRARQSPVVEGRAASAIFGSPSRETFRHMSDAVQGHEQRLDRLENVSFTTGGHDECLEKHDAVDLRVTDLEVRVEEVEKLMNDNSSHGTARHLRQPAVDESTTNSVVSVSTSVTARASDSSEIYSHIQSLQSQLRHLRSFVPSLMHSWEVEVVFLPFSLRRIWQERHDFKVEPTSNMDEWTQMPNTNSAMMSGSQSPHHNNWVGSGQDYNWLLAKACGARSPIDRRLKSRGLVKTISVKGPDARSVEAAMQAAFGSTLLHMSTTASASRRRSVSSKMDRFLGLRQSWVPLRKVHRDSRLRFLSPAEMVTPALWDVSFLNSVIMRASEPRLFITQPEAYLQDLQMHDQGWTWQRLRELSRVYPESSAAQAVPEADALEACWTWNEHLDEPVSVQSSLDIREAAAAQRTSASPSQHHFNIDSSLRSPSPYVTRGQSPRYESQPSRPIHIRTTSMPSSASALVSPSGVRRRVASSGQQRKGSATPQRQARIEAAVAAYKRQRTGSPSRQHQTPRWTASPSPALAMFPIENERPPPPRGITPLYYATPFSNAPLTEPRAQGSGGMRDEESDEDGEDDSGSTNMNDEESIYRAATGARFTIAEDSDVQQLRQLQPEDEPWPGIEDQDRISDGENIDPLFSPMADDATSVASSQPSEYPSTQRGWGVPDDNDNEGAGFRIHEDDDRMM